MWADIVVLTHWGCLWDVFSQLERPYPPFDWTVLSQSVFYINLLWLRVCQLQIESYSSHLCFLVLLIRQSEHNYLSEAVVYFDSSTGDNLLTRHLASTSL